MSTQAKLPRVLVVDDSPDIPFFFRHHAAQYGYALEFVYAEDVGAALDRLNERCCDAAVVDVELAGVTGVSLVQELRKHDQLIPLAYYTNLDPDDPANEPIVRQAVEHNAQFLYKQRFQMTDDGPRELIQIVDHLAHMNPCLPGGVRITELGFERQLPKTPIRMAEPFMKLLSSSRIAMAA